MKKYELMLQNSCKCTEKDITVFQFFFCSRKFIKLFELFKKSFKKVGVVPNKQLDNTNYFTDYSPIQNDNLEN